MSLDSGSLWTMHVGGTPESLELAMGIESGDRHVIHVTIIESTSTLHITKS